MKRYIAGIIILSASIFGMIILFYWSLSMIASGKIPLYKVPQLMTETIAIFLILTVILMIGLLLISMPQCKHIKLRSEEK